MRYVDTDTGAQNEQPGLFSRLFSSDKKAQAPQYRIRLTGSGTQTQVTVLDANGQRDRKRNRPAHAERAEGQDGLSSFVSLTPRSVRKKNRQAAGLPVFG